MSAGEILRLAAELGEQGRRFALATVVARQAPSSSRVGQKALVEADGTFHGWLGGSCIEPAVLKESRLALEDGRPRLVVLAPAARSDRLGATIYPMTCHSGGTVEIYVEPHLPSPVLALFGDSPVARALAAIGGRAGYAVRELREADDVREGVPEPAPRGADGDGPAGSAPAESRECYAVVATLGEWDEGAIEGALEAGARYVGLVASPRRAAEVRRRLLDRGISEERLAPLVSPAGLDIGAREPAEIAISILAELIEHRRRSSAQRSEASTEAEGSQRDDPSPDVAVDPVCGMEVEVAGARHTLEHEGSTLYFCCPGCREAFAKRSALAIES